MTRHVHVSNVGLGVVPRRTANLEQKLNFASGKKEALGRWRSGVHASNLENVALLVLFTKQK